MKLDGKRILARSVLRPLVRWRPMHHPVDGWSIVIGVPWNLRAILDANIRFLQGVDRTGLHEIILVFDTAECAEGIQLLDSLKSRYRDLPIRGLFHPKPVNILIRAINQSKFYATTNWILGLRACRTRIAVLHDFDLYPLAPDYFHRIMHPIEARQMHFTSTAYTRFGGLEHSDRMLATWALGIDVEWARRSLSAVDCYHRAAMINGRVCELDPFCFAQMKTDRRERVDTVNEDDFSHVFNLCSTYLRVTKGEGCPIAWRMHYLWYLEELSGAAGRVAMVTTAMREATSPVLDMFGYEADCSKVHVTCANVLETELGRMEKALYGYCRPEISEYIDAFRDMLFRFGDKSDLIAADGTVKWRLADATT